MFARLRCFVRQHHSPRRHPLGGFRCEDCGMAGADLEDMGFVDAGWIGPLSRTYDRKHGEYTRNTAW
jgi:hypothetical protein